MTSFLNKTLGETANEVVDIGRFIAGVAAVWLAIVTFLFAPFHIPSESMQPELEVGDRVLVSKWAYGYSRHSLPLGIGYYLPDSLDFQVFPRMPERGDVVVFRAPEQRRNLIKRVIGLPGDVIEVRGGRLFVNGELVARDHLDSRTYIPHQSRTPTPVEAFIETLPGGVEHEIYEHGDGFQLDDSGPHQVPENHVFVMGDNRDRSTDSRVATRNNGPGYIHITEVVGRAETVMFTFQRCRRQDGIYCPTGRVWEGL